MGVHWAVHTKQPFWSSLILDPEDPSEFKGGTPNVLQDIITHKTEGGQATVLFQWLWLPFPQDFPLWDGRSNWNKIKNLPLTLGLIRLDPEDLPGPLRLFNMA